MPGTVKFDIQGAREMERLLKELGPRTAAKVGDQAVRAGLKPILREAQRLVPVRSGDLRDAMVIRTEKRRRADDERVAVLAFKSPTSRRAHLTEFGTRHAPAKPFVRPAMDSKAGEALDEMGKVLGRGITREAEKLAKD